MEEITCNLGGFGMADHNSPRVLRNAFGSRWSGVEKYFRLLVSHGGKKYCHVADFDWFMSMLTFHETGFELYPGLTISAKICGNPTSSMKILFCHGFLDNANSFDAIIPFILQNNDAQIVAIDFSGHGKSSHLPKLAHYNLAHRVNELFLLSQQLNWKKFILVGHSMGAFTSSIFAGTFPHLLTKLVLLEGIGAFLKEISAPKVLQGYVESFSILFKQPKIYNSLDDMIDYSWTSRGKSPSRENIKLLIDRGHVKVQNGYSFSHDLSYYRGNAIQWHESDVQDFLRNIHCPVLLIYDKNPKTVQNFGSYFNDRIKCVKDIYLVGLDGGHHLHMENPEETANVINKFLNQSSKSTHSSKL